RNYKPRTSRWRLRGPHLRRTCEAASGLLLRSIPAGNHRLNRRGAVRVFVDDNMSVAFHLFQNLNFSRRPADRQCVHRSRFGQTEVNHVRRLRAEAVVRIKLAHDLLPVDDGNESRSDSLAVAGTPVQRYEQRMPSREAVFKKQEWSAAGLTHEQIH